jgi:uncharacterized protein (DUF2141 family)
MPAEAGDLVVHITDLHSNRGHVRLSLFDSDRTWLDEKRSLTDITVPAERGTVTVTFPNLPRGRYAVGTIHDEEDHGGMVFDLLGLPEEGFAFSRNVRPFLAAPSFDSAAVQVGDKKTEITIKMVYP